jgi:hypothetical protein
MGKPVTVYQNGSEEALPVIDYVHQKVHEGYCFTANHYVSVGTGTAVTVLITPPAAGSGRFIHLIGSFQSNNTGVFTFSEDPVATAGSALTSYNNNRPDRVDSPDPVVLKHTTTVAAASIGTVLETIISTSTSTNQQKLGDAGSNRNEWILDGAYKYLMRFVADNASTRVVFTLNYYYKDE